MHVNIDVLRGQKEKAKRNENTGCSAKRFYSWVSLHSGSSPSFELRCFETVRSGRQNHPDPFSTTRIVRFHSKISCCVFRLSDERQLQLVITGSGRADILVSTPPASTSFHYHSCFLAVFRFRSRIHPQNIRIPKCSLLCTWSPTSFQCLPFFYYLITRSKIYRQTIQSTCAQNNLSPISCARFVDLSAPKVCVSICLGVEQSVFLTSNSLL